MISGSIPDTAIAPVSSIPSLSRPSFALIRRLFGGRASASAAQEQPASQIAGPIPPQPVSFPNVVFLGNSITQGQHTDDFTFDYFWQVIVQLRERSSANAQFYLVDGVGGDTTSGFLAHLKALNLHPSNAQLIVVELGTNDYLQNVPLATVQQNYAALLAYLLPTNPQARLVALTIWSDPNAPNTAGITGIQYNDIIRQQAATWRSSRGNALVDISTLYLNPANRNPPGSSDTFHPNDTGHTAIARAVLAAV